MHWVHLFDMATACINVTVKPWSNTCASCFPACSPQGVPGTGSLRAVHESPDKEPVLTRFPALSKESARFRWAVVGPCIPCILFFSDKAYLHVLCVCMSRMCGCSLVVLLQPHMTDNQPGTQLCFT
jgi:hypothetical protein